MSATELRSFLWSVMQEKCGPATQTLQPMFAVNSAAFIIDVALMRQIGDRVGERPVLFEMGETISYEIDWEEQFAIAARCGRPRL